MVNLVKGLWEFFVLLLELSCKFEIISKEKVKRIVYSLRVCTTVVEYKEVKGNSKHQVPESGCFLEVWREGTQLEEGDRNSSCVISVRLHQLHGGNPITYFIIH